MVDTMESPLKGKVLVAAGELQDPNFARSIVLIIQHDENGAMGLVINRPLETTVAEAWTQVSAVPYPNEDPLFQGGPCEGPLMVVHKEPDHGQMEITPGMFLSSDADAVKSLVNDAVEPLKFFVGYSGWSPRQLETEIAEGAWHVAAVDAEDIFWTPPQLWDGLIRKSQNRTIPAIDPRLIPPDPSVN